VETEVSLVEFKNAFAAKSEFTHLNNAGLAPITRAAKDIVNHWVERFYQEGVHCNDDYLIAVEYARSCLAQLFGCKAPQIAFFQSTAGGISQMATGVDLQPGDEVIMWDQEYSSNLYPWRAAAAKAGAKLVLVQSGSDMSTPVEKILAAITAKTKAVAISWVQFQTGAVTDLKTLSQVTRAQNIWTVIDVVQGMGLLPFSFAESGVDAISGGSHKWLCSPVGLGYLVVREDRIARIRPIMVGSGTYGTCDDIVTDVCTPKSTSLKFEAGSRQVLEIVAAGASAEVFLKTGIQAIQAESERLALKLRLGLKNLGYQINSPHGEVQRGGIVNFSGFQDWTQVQLRKNKISFGIRGPGLRFSPHAFNDDDDIEKTLKCLADQSRK
jgi:cysteine desulfurase/selenocysteine lyase